ncbi:MAG: methionine--tRNA ligase [Rhodospirillales bacterium]|nr:methionine--tRNA ligase [Rhodospirillales bacterium]
MADKKPFYITTPIYYVNDIPHLGHTYTSIACDVMARFKTLDGYDVKFLTGTDEHGLKVYQAASKAGVDTQAFVDKVSQNFRDIQPLMNLSNDDFIRTTEPRHIKAAQGIWNKLVEAGDIYLDKYSGWYAMRDEAYYGEDELTDVDGKKVAPSGAECEWVEEESYFFRLSAWREKLLAFYEAHPDFVQPEGRYNEVKSFVSGELRDLSISRTTFDWGVPVPGNDKHVMYVWIDALTNYITALGYPDTEAPDYKKFWPADYHVVGKDILRFHAVYWPAFLMAAGLEPPQCVFAHGWWTIEGQKMSKSLGNAISPHDLVERYGVDASRYFLMRHVPFGNDGNFAHEDAVNRINSDLANSLGNLAQRTLSMIHKNCDGQIPHPGEFLEADKNLLDHAQSRTLPGLRRQFDKFMIHRALEDVMHLVNEANTYIDHQAPWTLKKEDPERMKTVLYVLAETIRCLGLMMLPITPDSASKMLDQLKIPADARDFSAVSADSAIPGGTPIDKPEGIFPRIVEEEQQQAAG